MPLDLPASSGLRRWQALRGARGVGVTQLHHGNGHDGEVRVRDREGDLTIQLLSAASEVRLGVSGSAGEGRVNGPRLTTLEATVAGDHP